MKPGFAKQFASRQPKGHYFPYDKEHLYAEAMKLKNSMNGFRDKNTQLKTKIAQYGKELEKKDRIIHELLGKVSPQANADTAKAESTHLANALREQIRVTQEEISAKDAEIAKLNKSVKTTKLLETDIEIKMFMDEATRLKHIIDEILKQKAASYTPEDIEAIQAKINQQNYLIENIKQQNENISKMLERKEEEMSNWRSVYEKLQSKLNKLESEARANSRSRTQLSDSKKELQSLKAQLAALKGNGRDKAGAHRARIEELLRKDAELSEKLEAKDKKLKALEAKLEGASKDSGKLQELMRLRKHVSDSTLSTTLGEFLLSELKRPNDVPKPFDGSELKPLVTELRLRLILESVTPDFLHAKVFAGYGENESITVHELSRMLKRKPVKCIQDMKKLARYLVEPNADRKVGEVIKKLEELLGEYSIFGGESEEKVGESIGKVRRSVTVEMRWEGGRDKETGEGNGDHSGNSAKERCGG